MPLRRLVAFAPLILLAACGGAPNAGPNAWGGKDATYSGRGTNDQASLPTGPVAEPARLKGLSPLQVKSVLGKPIFTRRDAPAEIWQYRSRACTLDLFLYDEGASQTVAHYAVRSPQPVAEKECFDELVSRNRGIPTG